MDEVFYVPPHVWPIKSHGVKLAPSQHQDGPFPHEVHGKRSSEISVEELFAGCDRGYRSSCLDEVFATHSGAYEPKAVLCISLQLLVTQCKDLLSVLSPHPLLLLDYKLPLIDCQPDGAPLLHQLELSTKLSPHLTMSGSQKLKLANFQELSSQYNCPCRS